MNRRLTKYVENLRKLINFQCGFRKNRSTLDHLVRLDVCVKKSLAEGKRVSINFLELGVYLIGDLSWGSMWRESKLTDL